MWFLQAASREKIHESTTLPNSSACVARVSRAVSRDHGLRAQSIAPVIEVPNPPNAAAQQSKPYIYLVSLDGFVTTMRKVRREKISWRWRAAARAADGMIPSFSFSHVPNHYAIVTVVSEHHGIVC